MREVGGDVEHLKAVLAAEIARALSREGLTLRQAATLTGTTAADFSRIRASRLERFTVDRLILIVNKLGSRVDVMIKVRRAADSPFLDRDAPA